MIEIWGKTPGGLVFIVLVSMVIICVVGIVAWRLWRLGVVIVVVVVVIVVVIIVISPGHHWVHVALNPFETVSKSIIITVGVTLVVVWLGVLFANIGACKDIPMFFPRAVVPALVFTGAGLIIDVIEFTLVRVASLFWAWESLIPARMSIGTIWRVAFWIPVAVIFITVRSVGGFDCSTIWRVAFWVLVAVIFITVRTIGGSGCTSFLRHVHGVTLRP